LMCLLVSSWVKSQENPGDTHQMPFRKFALGTRLHRLPSRLEASVGIVLMFPVSTKISI
jgi:hypothetical protein